jgi:hypothetical protein
MAMCLDRLKRIAEALKTYDYMIAAYGRSSNDQVQGAVLTARRLREGLEM